MPTSATNGNTKTFSFSTFAATPSIQISGILNGKTAQRVRSEISACGEGGHGQIILYIDSHGGNVAALLGLHSLLRRRRQLGGSPEIITIAKAAKSAAACLLVMGHRAFMLAGARLQFHGAVLSDSFRMPMLNCERAIAIALQLDRENRKVARRMATAVMGRIYRRCGLPLAATLFQAGGKRHPVPRFVDNCVEALHEKLRTEKGRLLLRDAARRLKAFLAVSRHLPSVRIEDQTEDFSRRERRLHRAFATWKLAQARSLNPAPGAAAAIDALLDYQLLRDLARGIYLAHLGSFIRRFGEDFLTRGETCAFERLRQGSKSKARALLARVARPYVFGLWCLSLTLCNRLLLGEHELTATDARQLGLIDGVLSSANARKWGPPQNTGAVAQAL